MSDNGALISELANSDSDMESNSSPTKHTPYSTYSSNCSSNHPAYNEMALKIASNSEQNRQNNDLIVIIFKVI